MKSQTKYRLKSFSLIFLKAFGIVAAACAVVVLGLYLFGAFSKANVPLESMHFEVNGVYNQNGYYYVDEDCYVKVVSYPIDATELNISVAVKDKDGKTTDILELGTENNKLNKRINLSVKQEEIKINNVNVKVNKGGVVVLSAKSTDRSVVSEATCTIFVDTLVQSYTTKLQYKETLNNNIVDVEFDEDSNSFKYIDSEEIERVVPLYNGMEFYVSIDEVFPFNSLNTFDKIEATKNYKTFTVVSDHTEYAQIIGYEYPENGMPRAKVKIVGNGSFNLKSSLINSYNNMLKLEDLNNKLGSTIPTELSNPEEYERQYASIVNGFTKTSTSFDLSLDALKVNEIKVETDSLNELNVNNSYSYNSNVKTSSNPNGLGIKFISEINTPETNLQVTQEKLSSLQVLTGYVASVTDTQFEEFGDKKIVISKEFISANKVFDNGVLTINVNVYKQKQSSGYQNYIILKCDDAYAFITVTIKDEEYPSFTITQTDQDVHKTIIVEDIANVTKSEYLDLLGNEFKLFNSLGTELGSEYAVAYFLFKQDGTFTIDETNAIVENENGEIVGALYEDDNGIDKNFHTYVIPKGLGTVYIKAVIVKKDFAGNIINYVESAEGQYGYYDGKFDTIENIKQKCNLTNYVGTRYSDNGYLIASYSTNKIVVEIKDKLQIQDLSVLAYGDFDANDENEYENALNLDEETNGIKLINENEKLTLKVYEGEASRLYLIVSSNDAVRLMNAYNEGLLTFEIANASSLEGIIDIEEFGKVTQINGEDVYGIEISIIRAHSEEIPIRVRYFEENSNFDKTLYVKINSTELESIELKENISNSTQEIDVNGSLNGENITFTETNFSLDIYPSRAKNSFVFDNVEFVYSSDNLTWKTYEELDNKIVQLSFNGENDIIVNYLKVGKMYVKANYYVDSTLFMSSNAFEFNVSVQDLVLLPTNDGVLEFDKYNVLEDDIQEINLANENFFKLYPLNDSNQPISNGLNLVKFEIFSINGVNYASNTNLHDKIYIEGNKLIVKQAVIDKQVILFRATSIYGTLLRKIDNDYFDFLFKINVLPNIKAEIMNSNLTFVNNEYHLTVTSGTSIQLKDYLLVQTYLDDEGTQTTDLSYNSDIVYSQNGNSYALITNLPTDDVTITFTNSGELPVVEKVFIEVFEGYKITINVTINKA